MKSPIAVEGVAAPFGPYNHAVSVAGARELLFVAGQVGVALDGSIASNAADQTKVVFENIGRVLSAADMSFEHIVRMSFFVCHVEDLPEIRRVRDSLLKPPFPAASLVVVKALGRPNWRIEVECIASR